MTDEERAAPRAGSLGRLRREDVVKDDGRYLIYYSWPGADDRDGSAEARRPESPSQQPWSPEGGPADV